MLGRRLIELPYREHRVTTSDGVDLAVQTIGAGPAILMINGIGVIRPALDMLIGHLRSRHLVVSWDYRGAGGSVIGDPNLEPGPSRTRTRAKPPPPDLERLTLPRHAGDAIEILDALGIDEAVVLGWSMGVPVGLEVIRRAAERVTAFGALFGAPGPPFRAAFDSPVSDMVELGFRASRHFPWPADALVRLGMSQPWLGWAVCSGIRFVGPRAQRHLFHSAVSSVGSADKRVYLAIMKHLMAHDARDVLPEVRCPTIIFAGENDWVTPPHAAIEMRDQVAHAELHILANTSHFGVMEHGPALWRPLDQFLAELAAEKPHPA